jgi:isopentenyl-diphosphate delta-isomerase
MADITNRKKQHIELAKNPESQINREPFAEFKLPYKTLPEVNLKDVSTKAPLLDKTLSQPLIIASMTGGTENSAKINQNIAMAAEETGVAMGVGSQRVALEIPESKKSFEVVRKHAPNAFVFANMGAIQLNHGYDIDKYKQAVEMIEADALYLHINALQEAVQPEGDTDFERLTEKIAELVKKIEVPVFIKEVGHGIDKTTAKNLIEIGVAGIDIAGANGTSWAWIDAKRKEGGQLAEWFKSEGITLEDSLLNIRNVVSNDSASDQDLVVIASGGVRNPIQGVKARLHGADFYSAAYPFLDAALESPEKLIEIIMDWQKGLQTCLFYMGVAGWDQLESL